MERIIKRWEKYKQVAVYGFSLAVLLFLLKFIELNYLIMRHSFELYAGLIALIFTALGIWLALKLMRPKVLIMERPVAVYPDFRLNEKALEERRISPRELEVLQELAGGLSNREIAGKLFVSENTIKTHAASLYLKLDAARRAEAVEKARQLGLLP